MRTFSWLLVFGLTAAPVRVITFDNAQLGRIPPDWTVAMTNHGRPPRWEIVKDMSAATQPYVFAQTSSDPLRDRCPLAVFNDITFRDGEVSVRLKPVSGREVQAGGLVWRYRDEKSLREMAELCGKTEKAMERLLARARENFRRRWNDAGSRT